MCKSTTCFLTVGLISHLFVNWRMCHVCSVQVGWNFRISTYQLQLASHRLLAWEFQKFTSPLTFLHPVFCSLFEFIIIFHLVIFLSSTETQDTYFLIQDFTLGLLRSEALPLGGNVFILKKNQTKNQKTKTPTNLLWRHRLKLELFL